MSGSRVALMSCAPGPDAGPLAAPLASPFVFGNPGGFWGRLLVGLQPQPRGAWRSFASFTHLESVLVDTLTAVKTQGTRGFVVTGLGISMSSVLCPQVSGAHLASLWGHVVLPAVALSLTAPGSSHQCPCVPARAPASQAVHAVAHRRLGAVSAGGVFRVRAEALRLSSVAGLPVPVRPLLSPLQPPPPWPRATLMGCFICNSVFAVVSGTTCLIEGGCFCL